MVGSAACRAGTAFAALWLGAFLQPAAAVPQPPPSSIDETDGGQFPFGTYDENSPKITACKKADKSEACGPVAAINSLVYLQNRFPYYYYYYYYYANPKPMLVPDTSDKGINTLANTLAKAMNCNCQTGGTSPGGMAMGLRSYMKTAAPETITDVTQVINPTLTWLMTELYHGEDVELLITEYDKNPQGKYTASRSHWITATGAATNDVNGNGYFDAGDTPKSLSYIDPGGDGSQINSGETDTDKALGLTSAITGHDQLDLPAYDWGQPSSPAGAITVIADAVSESPRRPIPEPGGLALLGSATILLVRSLARGLSTYP